MRVVRAKRCVLAVDSGGTKCDAAVVRDDGIILGWGHCDRSDPESGRGVGGSGRSDQTVATAVMRALEGIECDELHALGGLPSRAGEVLAEHVTGDVSVSAQRVDEPRAALALADVDAGIVVLAGTGAFVYGKTRDGSALMLDGIGPDLGDHGGGYYIGLRGLRAAAKSGWHPRHETSLVEPIYLACQGDPDDTTGRSLWPFMAGRPDRADVAALARIVDAEARAGDRIALSIMEDAAAAIAETIRDVVHRLDMACDSYPMIGIGSVATKSAIYWRRVCEIVHEFAPGLKPTLRDAPQVLGFALIALRELDPDNIKTTRHRLFESAREAGVQIA